MTEQQSKLHPMAAAMLADMQRCRERNREAQALRDKEESERRKEMIRLRLAKLAETPKPDPEAVKATADRIRSILAECKADPNGRHPAGYIDEVSGLVFEAIASGAFAAGRWAPLRAALAGCPYFWTAAEHIGPAVKWAELKGNDEPDRTMLELLADALEQEAQNVASSLAPDPAGDGSKARGGQKSRPATESVGAALAVKAQHPEWSDAKIASEVGCSPSTLCKSDLWKAGRNTVGRGRTIRRGSKDKDGDIEAVDD